MVPNKKHNKNYIDVCCAIILINHKILAAKRKKSDSRGGLWEFPGGKIEYGETPEQCIKREIIEELEIDIEIIKNMNTVEHRYNDINIRLIPFLVTAKTDKYRINNHEEVYFFEKHELEKLEWAEADRMVLQQLMSNK